MDREKPGEVERSQNNSDVRDANDPVSVKS